MFKSLLLLCEEWVHDGVEDGDEDEDEGGVHELHLVGLDDVGADGAVHPVKGTDPCTYEEQSKAMASAMLTQNMKKGKSFAYRKCVQYM